MKHRLFLTLLSTLSLAHAGVPEEKLGAEVRPLGWLIYSARSPAGDWDLFAARPDGSDARNLTHTPETSEFCPQLTTDGLRLLYRRVPKSEGIDGNRYGLQGEPVLAHADASKPRVLEPAGGLPWAAWSPDGRQVACLAPKGFTIVEIESGKTVREFPRAGFFQQITWSPDGKSLLGVSNGFGTGWSVATLEIATGKVAAVNREDCCTPDWSADGRAVIFSWRPPKEGTPGAWTQLWLADAAGTQRRLLYAEDGRHTYGGCLSPDGRYALFTGNAAEDGDPHHAGSPMQIMRVADAPLIGGESPGVRAAHPGAQAGPLLTLPAGWEPFWTAHEIFPDTLK